MKVYNLKRTQVINVTLSEAWDFFATPKNLNVLTPPEMKLKITAVSGSTDLYAGQLIQYTVCVFPLIITPWTTEITHVYAKQYFIDEQRFGPFAMWHHQHHFREVAGGVEMTDEINYAIPLGILGRLANTIFVSRQLNAIFEFRYHAVEKYFSKHRT